MKLTKLGRSTSKAEVLDILIHGIWVYIDEKEYFLPYKNFPWFKEASVSEIHNIKLLNPNHLYWPDLDVDLELDSIKHPQNYPLAYR